MQKYKKIIVHLCPGQGFQIPGMTLKYLKHPQHLGVIVTYLFYQAIFKELTSIIPSLENIMLNGPQTTLNQTQYTQPAVFIHSYLSFINQPPLEGKDILQYCIGHSVGEYTAFALNGQLEPKQTVEILKKRGTLMNDQSSDQIYGMLAIKSSNIAKLEELISEVKSQQQAIIDIALLNSPNQTVISGGKASLQALQTLLKKNQISSLFLQVSSAFHSSVLKPCKEEFKEFLAPYFKENTSAIQIISNYSGEEFQDRQQIIHNLTQQFDHPVLFNKSISNLLRRHQFEEFEFIEYGSNVLVKFVKDIVETEFKGRSIGILIC